MDKEDYTKYYIQGSDHYLLPKNVFIELFDEMNNWKEESKKKDEVIEKAIEYIENNVYYSVNSGKVSLNLENDDYYDLLQILEDKGEIK